MQLLSLGTERLSGYKMPVKKTYRAMQSFYESINDKGTAQVYRFLDEQAKARLHYHKSKQAVLNGAKALDAITADANPGILNALKYVSIMVKTAVKAGYERAASAYYYHKL